MDSEADKLSMNAKELAEKILIIVRSCNHENTWFDRTIYSCIPSCEERMHDICESCHQTNCQWQSDERLKIESLLQEALDEAETRGSRLSRLSLSEYQEIKNDASKEALEQAAKLCEDSVIHHEEVNPILEGGQGPVEIWNECTKDPFELAEEIRQLKGKQWI